MSDVFHSDKTLDEGWIGFWQFQKFIIFCRLFEHTRICICICTGITVVVIVVVVATGGVTVLVATVTTP